MPRIAIKDLPKKETLGRDRMTEIKGGQDAAFLQGEAPSEENVELAQQIQDEYVNAVKMMLTFD